MRIAFFHELPQGGARIAVNDIASYLRKKHKVDLYYVDSKSSENETLNYKNVDFYRFIPRSWMGHDFKARLYKDTLELKKISSLHKHIAKDIDSRNYDLVFVNASKFIESPFILKYLKTFKVFYLHDPHFRVIYEPLADTSTDLDPFRKIYEKAHKRLLARLDKQNIAKADLLIANSRYTQKRTYKSYGLESKIGYLGVDTNFFKPGRSYKKIIDVLYIGSHDPLDGYSLLKDSTKYFNKPLKIRTVFKETEWASREKVRELYRKSKIVICLGRNEPFGLIPLEAGAVGVPVIALNEGGYPETVIDRKSGYLINNPKDLAKKLNYLISHPEQLRRMSKYARKNAVDRWDWKKRIEDIEGILKNNA